MVGYEKGKKSPLEQQILYDSLVCLFLLAGINCFGPCLSANTPDEVHKPVGCTYVCCECTKWKSTTKYGVWFPRYLLSVSPQSIVGLLKLTAAEISPDHHQHCLHGRMKVEAGRLSSVVLNSILPCGHNTTNSKFDKYRKCCFRSYCEAVASYRYSIPEGVHCKIKLSS